jgi:hypothetical protein
MGGAIIPGEPSIADLVGQPSAPAQARLSEASNSPPGRKPSTVAYRSHCWDKDVAVEETHRQSHPCGWGGLAAAILISWCERPNETTANATGA